MNMKDPYERHLAEVIDVVEETSNTNTYTLKFVEEKVQREFSFIPGQFITISFPGVGEAMFSIASAMSDGESFATTIRKVGRVTTKIHELNKGDKLWVAGSYGNGWPMEQLQGKDILIITGGVGLPSPRPIINHVEENRDDYGFLEILYGTKTPLESIFEREFEAWSKMPRTKLSLTVDFVPEGVEWKHSVGVVTKLLDDMVTKPRNSIGLICGPEVMMHFAVQDLLRRGFHDEQLYLSLERRMRCGIAQCGHCQLGPYFVCKDGPVFKYSDIRGLPDCGI
jgi:NAD(P)H-flavin reductase